MAVGVAPPKGLWQTAKTHEEAVRRVQRGVSYAAVGRSMDVPTAVVLGWCKKAGVRSTAKPTPRISKSVVTETVRAKETVLEKYQKGVSLGQIAREMKLPYTSVYRLCTGKR